MGFLDFLKPKVRELTFDEAKKLVADDLENEEKQLGDFASKKFAEIKYLISALEKGAVFLNEKEIDIKEGNERFRRIVRTSQKNLVRQLKGLSQKISPPQNFDVNIIRDYSNSAMNSLNNDLLPYWKNVALAKLLLKEEIAYIGSNLKELSSVLEELKAYSNSDSLNSLLKLSSIAADFNLKMDEKEKLEKGEYEAEKQFRVFEKNISSLKGELSKLSSSDEADKVKGLEERLGYLEQEKGKVISSFNAQVSSVEKILKRYFLMIQDSPQQEEKELLKALMNSPEYAISLDPAGEKTKSILIKVKGLMESNSIQLKDKERGKKLALLGKLVEKDYFSEFFWSLNKVQSEIINLRKKLASSTLGKQLFSLKQDIGTEEIKAEEKAKDFAKLKEKRAITESEAETQKSNFISLFNRFFSEKFVVKE